MKSILGVIIGAIVIIAVIAGIVKYQENKKAEGDDRTAVVSIGITDATADITNVNEVELQVKGVWLHSPTEGWVHVSTNNETYGLLALKANNETKLYARENVAEGSYDQVRVALGDVTVKTKNQGDVKASTPTKSVTFTSRVVTKADQETHVEIDVLADQSLHTTTDGKYVFAPVMNVESRSNATVSVGENDAVTVSGGSVDSATQIGVDLDGSTKPNFKLNTTTGLTVDTSVVGATKFMMDGKVFTERPSDEDSDDKEPVDPSIDLDVDGSLKL